MRRACSLVTLFALLLLTGCAGVLRTPDEAHEVAAMLANHERLASLKTEEQRREFNVARTAFEHTANDTTRLNLALAMLLPHAPWHDDARVQWLLGGIEAPPGEQHSAHHDFAQLLLRLLSERQRAQRDEQRKADQLVIQLREERRRNEELQQKIESLRDIDREMRTRRKAP
jgi:hypothetical protein